VTTRRRQRAIAPATAVVAMLLLAGCDRAEPDGATADGGAAPATAQPGDGAPTGAGPEATGPGESAASAELRAELETLVAGTSSTPPPSGTSWFSATTAGALRSATVDSAGHAVVDFNDLRPLIPNASSSAGSAMLIDELNAAVFRQPAVQSVEYRMEGSCALFWEWLQFGCHSVQRP
jgi:hypothetical protein